MLKTCVEKQHAELESRGLHWLLNSCFHANPPLINSGWNEQQTLDCLSNLCPTVHDYQMEQAERAGYKGRLYHIVYRSYRSYEVKDPAFPMDGAALNAATFTEKKLKSLIIGKCFFNIITS